MATSTLPHRRGVRERSNATRRVLWVMKGLGRGGAERLAVSSAERFDRSRYDVEVAYVLPHKNAFVPALRTAGITVHELGRAGARLGWMRSLARLVRSGGFDLIHTHSPLPAVVVRALPSRARPPVVHTEHNLWSRYRRPTRIANAVTFRRNTDALAVSQGVADSMDGTRGRPRASVLHHGIDVAAAVHGSDARAAARRRLGLPSDALVIGSVANFTPKKDHAALIAAVAAIRDDHPDVRLVLIGSGPLEDTLRRDVSARLLDDTVLFAGSRDDVADVLPAFDLFVLSSRFEGLPIALLEAMAAGVPPVATAVGGVSEVVTDEVDGLLVPPEAPDALAATLRRALGDVALRRRLATGARRRAGDFDIAEAVRAMERWYDEVLS